MPEKMSRRRLLRKGSEAIVAGGVGACAAAVAGAVRQQPRSLPRPQRKASTITKSSDSFRSSTRGGELTRF